MYKLPEHLEMLVPYEPTIGSYRIRLDANESFLPTPEWLLQEIAVKIAGVDFHRYSDPLCTELREAFGRFFGVNPAHVTAGNGSDELISILVSSFFEPGECLALAEPDFSMYRIYAELAGVPLVCYQKKSDSLEINIDDLIAFVQKNKARMLMLSNPCNPTSQQIPLAEVCRLIERLDCLVVIDEAYMDFSQGSVLPFVEKYDNLIVLKTCSKIGMAAIRLGFAISNPVLTKALQSVRSPYNVNALTQVVGSVWLSYPDYIHACIDKIRASRDALYSGLCHLAQTRAAMLQVLSSAANFIFVHLTDARGVFQSLQAHGIAVRLMGEYLRITAGSPEENTDFLTCLEEILR